MSLLFLVPMTLSLVTASMAQKANDDLAEIIGLAAILSLLLSFVLAPWQLQLLILLFANTKALSLT